MRFREGLTHLIDDPLPGGGRVFLGLGDSETVYLQVTGGEDFEPDSSYAVVRDKWPSFEHSFDHVAPGHYRIQTKSIRVDLVLQPFSLRIEDTYGNVRFATAEDALSFAKGEVMLRRSLAPTEGVYGLGEHHETFNRNPGRFRFWSTDDPVQHPFKQYYCNIPFGVAVPGGANRPHGFFLDNPGELFFDVGQKNAEALQFEVKTGDLRLWLFFEETPAEVLSQYTELTGRMERPPLWALGFQQCRWSYMTADAVREVTTGFRSRRIPCDVIYMDIDYMEKFRVFTWSDERFPEHESFLSELIEDGFSPLCIIDPGVAVAKGYFAYDEAMKEDGFFLRTIDGKEITEKVWPGDVHMPDFTHPNTRTIWGKWQAEKLLDVGIAGVWNDMNEPAIFSPGVFTKDFPSDAIHYDFGRRRAHKQVHNIYGMTMAQASCEGQKTHYPERRPFTLTRSGWAGVQRYSAVWTGDNSSSYTAMRIDMALNLSMGMSGVAFVGCDIGGFANIATPELFARWFEWGALQPFCRAHSATGTLSHEPWAFGPATERVVKRMIELRYQLLPYIYAQFVECSETGMPVNRPLVMQYPNDATVMGVGDQFMLGPDILVAPMLDPGKTHRALYLPAGDWIHLWSQARHMGGRWVMEEAPLGRPPIYIRAGAVIPMHPVRQHTKEPEPTTVFLDIYPAETLDGRLIEDDGKGMGYRKGEECRVLFSGRETQKELNLMIGAPQGSWKSARKQWTIRLHRGDRPIASVAANDEAVPFEKIGDVTTFSIPDRRKALNVRVVYGG